MALGNRIYRRTASGEAALRSEDAAIPADYRRILKLVKGDTHANVLLGCLRQYPDELLADWIAELEQGGFLTSLPAPPDAVVEFTAPGRTASTFAMADRLREDWVQSGAQATTAGAALASDGAYLSPERLRNREPLRKTPAEVVVLLVEDDPDQAALADLRVSMAGYGVRLARNRSELLTDLRTKPTPDLILLDVLLPDGNGFDILTVMRRNPKTAILPVVMLTVMAEPDHVRRGLALGADGYITKPYSSDVLAHTIRQVLKHA